MKKKVVLFVLVLAIVIGFCFLKKDSKETIFVDKSKDNNNLLSMLLETEENSGKYEEVIKSEWPTEGYVFNTTLSRCENGGNLSWDNEKKIVIMDSDSSDKCYVYFDLRNTNNFANYIKNLYTGVQGENNLYLHDSTLENGANDNSYRYAGSSETTNNFVCFGYDSTDGTCPSDNLYRIIGVFGDNVKLIKYDYATSDLLGTDGDSGGSNLYYWNYNANKTINNTHGYNVWGASLLNQVNLNVNFLRSIGEKYSNKIAMNKWIVGGNFTAQILYSAVSTVFENEISNPVTILTYSAQVGLMYVSDYLYSASSSNWQYAPYDYINNPPRDYRLSIGSNWMYKGQQELTITPNLYNSSYIYVINSTGEVRQNNCNFLAPVRPTFYLDSSVAYVSGNGTKDMPYIID